MGQFAVIVPIPQEIPEEDARPVLLDLWHDACRKRGYVSVGTPTFQHIQRVTIRGGDGSSFEVPGDPMWEGLDPWRILGDVLEVDADA